MMIEFGPHRLQLVLGDIAHETTDAIVTAANAQLAGGGGVDGAVHRAAGPELLAELKTRYPEGCPTGSVVVTGAGRLSARYVFHAVGPIWQGGHRGEPELLKRACRQCLESAWEHQCQSIAMPALSSGAYGYPVDLAALHLLQAVSEMLETHPQASPLLLRFVLYDAGTYAAFSRVLETLAE